MNTFVTKSEVTTPISKIWKSLIIDSGNKPIVVEPEKTIYFYYFYSLPRSGA